MWTGLAYPDKWATHIGQSHKAISKVEVWTGTGSFLTLLGNNVSGSVDVDETRAVRRTCKLTVQSAGLEYDDLVPVDATSLLHPGSGNELRPYRGIDYQDGTCDYVPLGVFRMSKPTITDDGQSVNIDISGQDRSSLITRLKWRQPFVIAAGQALGTTIQAIINSRFDGYSFNFMSTNPAPDGAFYTLTDQVFGVNLAGDNDPFKDASSLALAAGLELFFDPIGQPTLRPFLSPAGMAVSRSYVEGVAGCTLLKATSALDETVEYNGVICIGNGTGGPPVRAEVWDTDVSSPSYYQGAWGQTPYIFESSSFPAPDQSPADAQNQAQVAAQAMFQRVRTALATPDYEIVPDPTLEPGDLIQVTRARMGVNMASALSKFSIPLDVESTMPITGRPATAA